MEEKLTAGLQNNQKRIEVWKWNLSACLRKPRPRQKVQGNETGAEAKMPHEALRQLTKRDPPLQKAATEAHAAEKEANQRRGISSTAAASYGDAFLAL